MNKLKVGFARIDITPPLGSYLQGYQFLRESDGILDPLYAHALAVSDGETTAIIISADLVGMGYQTCDTIRRGIEGKFGIPYENVFVSCTHIHTGPICTVGREGFSEKVLDTIIEKLIQMPKIALDDMKPAELFVNAAETPIDIAFIRRFRMKDGSVKTNPGFLNPDIDHPLGEPDKRVALAYFKRENAPEIALINFQVHPDVISGNKYSADFPGFVRKVYEGAVENSLCMYINGPQGDTNHFNVNTPEDELRTGYEFARHMGRTIAGVAMGLRAMAKKVETVPVRAMQKNLEVFYNKGTPEEIEKARETYKLYKEGRVEEIWPHDDMMRTTLVGEATRLVRTADLPDSRELYITGIAIGDFALVGFPGEPFTDIGRETKAQSPFKMTFASCCANGYEAYFPMDSAFDEGGYEARSTSFRRGTAEALIRSGVEVLNTLHSK
ncbi:MAG: neutral/alkaline non-lysosomal ceramidase N-terminal domain-containing protein [Oscillospiraceae bacterium]|nr:neutral/alkaline non-lysosomal ceramidase N-terminal domain-containing protein [Oscillospiraceae bacterium]